MFHLAALLSTRSEFSPVHGARGQRRGHAESARVRAARGRVARPAGRLPLSVVDRRVRPAVARGQARAPGRVREDQWTQPTTMYGCNKLYCEQLGHYYAHHYKQLSAEPLSGRVDFRAVRFPGLISAVTVPSGGTSDYAPEMIHAAAQRRAVRAASCGRTRGFRSWRCPTASTRCSRWRSAPRAARHADRLQPRRVRADGRRDPRRGAARVSRGATITYTIDEKRQGIVDSWPEDVDDSAARRDWGFAPAVRLRAGVPGVSDPDDQDQISRLVRGPQSPVLGRSSVLSAQSSVGPRFFSPRSSGARRRSRAAALAHEPSEARLKGRRDSSGPASKFNRLRAILR